MRYFLSEPYLLTLHPQTQMCVVWIQSVKAEGFVEFGMNENLGKRTEAECHEIRGLRAPLADGTYPDAPEECPLVSVWQYIAKIDGLSPGETVFYRVSSGEHKSEIYSFHTAPACGKNFRFAQMSDLQGLPDCNKTVYEIGKQRLDFILYSGDATYVNWRLDSWFDLGEEWQSEESRKKAFFPNMQQRNGARLLQYMPLFFCPGNHELDDMRCYSTKELTADDSQWNWSIFMQIFRPLYPTSDTSVTGRRWYSVDYGDLHIVSLSINRLCFFNQFEAPGWRLYDSIAPDSPQITWLSQDLKESKAKFKWAIQHFHILNKGWDVQFNLCSPVVAEDGSASYPYDHGGMLMDLFSENGVNAVSFGHSHVYERYYRKSTHYIEAAFLSVCFHNGEEEPHPSGLLPIIEDYKNRSFLIVERTEDGLFGTGYYADGSIPFDHYRIADANGVSVAPEEQAKN